MSYIARVDAKTIEIPERTAEELKKHLEGGVRGLDGRTAGRTAISLAYAASRLRPDDAESRDIAADLIRIAVCMPEGIWDIS